MKRGLIILFIIILTPLALATVPSMDSLDGVYDVKTYASSGGVPYEEYYEEECPIIFENKKPYYAKIGDDGLFQKQDLGLSPEEIKPALAKEQGITCGYQNIQQIRPKLETLPPKWAVKKTNLDRLRANAELNIGVRTNLDGTQTYLNPELKVAIEEGLIAPPRLPLPKPTINIITGDVVYETTTSQQEIGIIVIPVEFPDKKASKSISDVEDQFFGEDGFTSYFEDQSYGNLRLSGNVARSWYSMSQTMGYYGDNYEANIEELITEAVLAADDEIDYSQYDYNGDGIVDGLFVVHAGEPDENGGGNGEDIWSHYYSITPITVDGVQVIDYETVSEDSPTGIIAHEFGHYLGLPDMYDTDPEDGSSKGVGEWSLMGYGGYLDPVGSLDPYSKSYMNWLSASDMQDIDTSDYYTIYKDDSFTELKYYTISISDLEYFIIENRKETELMNGDKASGILIWHIDESIMDETGSWSGCRGTRWDCNTVNGDASHKMIDVEEADGNEDLDNNDFGESSDMWTYKCSFGKSCKTFSSESTPSSYSYDKTSNIFVGVYTEPQYSMEIGLSPEGTKMEAPPDLSVSSETSSSPETESDTIIIIIIISLASAIIIPGAIIFYKVKLSQS